MMHRAPFAGIGERQYSGFTIHSSKTSHRTTHRRPPELDATLVEDRYTQIIRKLQSMPSIRRYGEQRRLTALIPFGKILGRARHLRDRYAFTGSNKAEIECRLQAMAVNWSALGVFWFARSPWSHRRLIFLSRIVSASITGLGSYAASPGELNRLDKRVCRNLRAPCKGKTYDSSTTRRHDRSSTNGHLHHKRKVLPAKAGIAIRRVRWWQAMTADNHAHLQTMVAIGRQLRDEAQTLTAAVGHGRCLRTLGCKAHYGSVCFR